MIAYPNIDPVLIEIGPLAIRWYSLAYVAGIVLGGLYADWLNRKPPMQKNLKVYDDFMGWAIIGIILGGRLGYVLFYNLPFYLENPIDILKVWHGGMSFHGGLIGVISATIIFCKRHKVQIMPLFDLLACAAPIGIFFGRVANFINGELYGRVTDSPFGVIFPEGGPLPRHPSQLYESTLEGLVLFIALLLLARFTNAKAKAGVLSGVFLAGYGLSRMIIENFREPDEQIGFLFGHVTTGQFLSVPMLLIGTVIIFIAARKKHVA
ncbi:MAG: prolipoprotein diacylglyceryl transferase [Rickettsiaceae bacterium]|jgi:phosphatidylglycerol:prolipoprotein diacylglycerol transferase|nr:prolipoprotein diacylglyceryl transferase [Rickettsiaceae bacterium]